MSQAKRNGHNHPLPRHKARSPPSLGQGGLSPPWGAMMLPRYHTTPTPVNFQPAAQLNHRLPKKGGHDATHDLNRSPGAIHHRLL
ncbi:hypothetical protein ES703_53462 [subsurface metagenome]